MLTDRGVIIKTTPQVLIEFRAVATRPVAANGLGLSASQVKLKADGFEAAFPILEDIPAIFPA